MKRTLAKFAASIGVRWLCSLMLMSCAGPMNPFGAINRVTQAEATLSGNKAILPGHHVGREAKIHFYPQRQNWHDASEFRIIVEDTKGIIPTHRFHFYYNDEDITAQFIKNSRIEMDDDNQTMTIILSDLRLLPDRNNDITVVYQRDAFSPKVITAYEEPFCEFDHIRMVRNPASFHKNLPIIRTIERISLEEGVNPSFLSGLIAQESAFNPQAVSWAKAIGLTQVTPLAEKHIVDDVDWPQFPRLNRYSVAKIKSLILLGKVNKKNEWRLDEEKSIRGGIDYLNFIKEYWQRAENKQKIINVYGDNYSMEDIILASYNSGPFRVKKALERKGKNWLQSRKLREAKRYVGKVKSYCYHFSNSGTEAL